MKELFTEVLAGWQAHGGAAEPVRPASAGWGWSSTSLVSGLQHPVRNSVCTLPLCSPPHLLPYQEPHLDLISTKARFSDALPRILSYSSVNSQI